MASVFLSYDREDAARAKSVAQVLENAGHSVWWDRHITGGAQYAKEIEQALARADAVVVLWSERSVESAWVKDEAAAGRDSGRLVPVRLDSTPPPLGFRQYQTIDILPAGGFRRGRYRDLLNAVDSVVANDCSVPETPSVVSRRRWRSPSVGRLILAAAVALSIIGAGVLIWRLNRPPAIATVAVAAADDSRYARELARDFVAKLGRLQVANPESMNLVRESDSRKASFLFEVGGSTRGQQSEANLVLLSPGRRSILWSKDFQQPLENEADLRQQIAVSGAGVLGCAQDAATSEEALDETTLKHYLNGCATLAEVYNYYAGIVIPVFREVTRRAPRFKGGWAKLLLAEAEVAATDSTPKGAAVAADLRRDIVTARSLDPKMAEAYSAEIQLLPGREFKKGLQIADKGLALHPDNPRLLGLRAGLLLDVGRMNEAVAQAKRAAEIDALSPATQAYYINTLTYAGLTESAQAELRRAESLWPGAGPLIDARFRINARYGDPNISLEIMRSIPEPGTPAIFETFLLARIDRTTANIDRAVADAAALAASRPYGTAILIQVLGEFGRDDQIFDAIMKSRGTDIAGIYDALFRPQLRNFRRDPRFMIVAERAGLIDYWRSTGKWPDFCFEADQPYDCKAEAAKLG